MKRRVLAHVRRPGAPPTASERPRLPRARHRYGPLGRRGAKLSPRAFLRFWDLHAWAGVVTGLVLYIMFFAGGITLFRAPLQTWEEPLAQRGAAPLREVERTLTAAFASGALPDDMWLSLPKAARGEARVSFSDGTAYRSFWIDTQAQHLVPEREQLADFIYDLHFLWHDVTGRWLYYVAGLLAVALLLVLVTGVLIHLKDLVRHFYRFRRDSTRRALWSDLHKLLGVMGLPFSLAYAYTGAVIILAPLLLKVFSVPAFGGDPVAQAAVSGLSAGPPGGPGAPASSLPLEELLQRARRARPDLRPDYLHLVHHGHENGLVEVTGQGSGSPPRLVEVRLRERDGAPLPAPTEIGAAASLRRWVYGIHFVYFGGQPLRLALLFLSLAGCAAILSGNWIWLARRPPTTGNVALARLTAGVGAGVVVATSALFLVSRLLPLSWGHRGRVEELTFLGALLLCLVWSLVSRDRRTLWWRPLAVAAALLLPVPLLAARWSSTGLFGAGPRLPAVVAVDVSLLVAAALLGAAALALRRLADPPARSNAAIHGAASDGLTLVSAGDRHA